MEKEKPKRCYLWIFISILLMSLSAFTASYIQTDYGKVDVSEAIIPMANGEKMAVSVFKPKTATKQTPAPVVITSHGYLNNKEMQDMTAIELSRRGFVVFAMDAYYHGHSSGTSQKYLTNREFYALGMLDLVEFVYKNIDYIDKNKIGITGHSTGGRLVSYTLDAYGRNERITKGITNGAYYAGQPKDAGKYVNKVAAALLVANFPAPYLLENIPQNVNVGINLAYYDEGAPMQLTKIAGHFWGDLTVSPEAKNFINLVHPDTFKLDKANDYQTETGKPKITLSGYDVNQKVEIGKFYGSPEEKNMRVVYNPKEIHPLNHFSPASSEIMTSFFSATLGAPHPLADSNQAWLKKELVNAVGLIGFFIFIINFALALLNLPFFASLRASNDPQRIPTPKGQLTFYLSLLLGAIIVAATVMPFMLMNSWIFPDTTTQNTTSLFNQPSTNQIIIWAVLNALIALVLFVASYILLGRKAGIVPKKHWGLQISFHNFFKALILAFATVIGGYAFVVIAQLVFVTDFRLWVFAVKMINGENILVMFQYLIPFFVFYAVNSLVVNGGNRIEGQKECTNLFWCILGNVAGLIAVIAIQYGVLFATGEAMWQVNLTWLCIVLLFPFIPILIIATVYSRILYRNTGTIWLGAMLNSILFTLITVANTTTITTL